MPLITCKPAFITQPNTAQQQGANPPNNMLLQLFGAPSRQQPTSCACLRYGLPANVSVLRVAAVSGRLWARHDAHDLLLHLIPDVWQVLLCVCRLSVRVMFLGMLT